MSHLAASAEQASDWRTVAADMIAGARAAIMRFPVTVAALSLLALQVNLAVAGSEWFEERGETLFLGLFAAACASLAVSLFGEARGARQIVGHSGGLAAALVAFLLVWWEQGFATYALTLIPALAGMVLVAPYLGRGDGAAFWMFSVRFAFAVLLAGLALLLFAGGISAILASLTYLFDLEVPERAYEHVWAATGLLAAPLFGLGQVPRDFDAAPDVNARDFMERGMRALGDFVTAPLLLIYAGILHAYALKIVFSGEVPQGQIGWLVLAFGICVIASLILIHPFLTAARAPTRLFLRLWPLVLPAPLLLLFYAVMLRIEAHGVTPERYLLALFGMVAAVIVALQIPRRTRGDIRWLAALPVLALLLASFGPQGALGVSIRSQEARFQALVAEQPLTNERHDQALSAPRFLFQNGAIENLAPEGMAVTRADGEQNEDDRLFREIAAAHGIDPDITLSPEANFSRNYPGPAAFAVSGFDLVVPSVVIVEDAANVREIALPSGRVLYFRLDGNAVVVARGKEEIRFPIAAGDIEKIAAVAPPVAGRTADAAEPLLLEQGQRRLMIVPTDIYGETQGAPAIKSIGGTILLRSADWPPMPTVEPSRR